MAVFDGVTNQIIKNAFQIWPNHIKIYCLREICYDLSLRHRNLMLQVFLYDVNFCLQINNGIRVAILFQLQYGIEVSYYSIQLACSLYKFWIELITIFLTPIGKFQQLS